MSLATGGLMSCVGAELEPAAPYRASSVHTQTHTQAHTQTHAQENRHGEGRKGRFLRGLRRMFRRRPAADHSPDSKSRSTSELLQHMRQRRKEEAYSSGLSVSHDSVFTGDRSGDESSDERPAQGHAARLSSPHRAELVAAVRRRGRGGDVSDDDEDLGLPRSPPASPPTDKGDKRGAISASSCSDGSMLSVGSSEMDEDSSSHQLSHDNSARSDVSEYTGEPPSGVAPLSHSAARHKMAVRPRRTHGAPRRKKNLPIATPALPITPELNEEMIRSATPEVKHKTTEVVTESFSSSTTAKILTKEVSQLSKELPRMMEATPSDIKLKSSSLPPGLALSHLVGQSPAKLSLAEPQETPRSSIKRSKSSTQGKSLRDESPPPKITSKETQIHTSRTEERVSRYSSKEAQEKKKSEKKSDEIRSSRKDESFFSRLLLRRSKKDPKVKKDSKEELHDQKKPKPLDIFLSPQYKFIDREYSSTSQNEMRKIQQRTHSADRSSYISAGQKAFVNQTHKRMDNRGVYVHDTVHSISKSSIDYGANDLKIAEETDKMLNMDLKYSYKTEKSKRNTSNEDSFNLHAPERPKRSPMYVQQFIDPYCSKAFISNEVANSSQSSHLSPKIITNDMSDGAVPNPRQRPTDFVFHSGSMPKAIPYFNQHLKLSASASPPKSVLHQSSENTKKLHRSTELSSISFVTKETDDDFVPVAFEYPTTQQEKDYASELRSLGEEYIEPRTSIGKSHSFRHQSETTSISSQDQMPSLPAIVGISEPLMESWEVNYRRNVNNNSARFNACNNNDKRNSARNYNVFNPSINQFDSLPSTDSSYLDSLKGDSQTEERKPLFINNVLINETHKRDSDISQIEANIDNIIGSPKPLLSSVLKSSSLNSVKSLSDKPEMEDRRKTISVESALGSNGRISSVENVSVEGPKSEPETYVSITHLNKDQTRPSETPKASKSDEKLQTNATPGVPEFLKIQLNKVDSKPATNVVLTANLTPKKVEPIPILENNLTKDADEGKDANETPLQIYLRKTGSQNFLNRSLEFLCEESPKMSEKPIVPNRNSPLYVRKSAPPSSTPQTPTTPKMFVKRIPPSIDETKYEKSRANSLSTDSNEKICEMDQKSFSSFGSKTSLQSSDSNEAKTPEKVEDGVVYRRKPIMVPKELRNGSKHDDEPELMKVFARRSLKLKDSEADILAQEIAEMNNVRGELVDNVPMKSKFLKNELNSSIKSRDSDKENEDQMQDNTDIKIIDLDTNKMNNDKVPNIQSRASHFGGMHYQRSISVSSVTSIQTNPKRDSAPAQMRNEVSKYRKEISDSTPEKRLRNRTFPDSSNDRDDIKGITAKNESLCYKTDTISKRPWYQKKEDEKKVPLNNLSVLDKDKTKDNEADEVNNDLKEMEEFENEKECIGERETEASPQFKSILQMRAEWERRAKQGMTK